MRLPIGDGDFERDISVLVDGKEGMLKIKREISRDYGERKNQTGSFMYTFFLDHARLFAYSGYLEIIPKTLLRIAPEAVYSIEPEEKDQPRKMRKGEFPFNPIRTLTFIPPMLEEPTKAHFNRVRLFRPDDRSRDWYCGYYNEGEELGISPIEIAHGYVGNDFLADPKRNVPHYHRQVLEGWVPFYGVIDAIFSPVPEAQVSSNRFRPVPMGNESLSDIVNNIPIRMHVNISPENITAAVPGEAHLLHAVKGAGVWETLTFKYPGLSREESEKDKVEYPFKG